MRRTIKSKHKKKVWRPRLREGQHEGVTKGSEETGGIFSTYREQRHGRMRLRGERLFSGGVQRGSSKGLMHRSMIRGGIVHGQDPPLIEERGIKIQNDRIRPWLEEVFFTNSVFEGRDEGNTKVSEGKGSGLLKRIFRKGQKIQRAAGWRKNYIWEKVITLGY